MHRDPAVVVVPLALRGRSPVVVPGVDVIARGAVAVAAATETAEVLGRVLARSPGAAAARVRLTGSNCARGPMLVQVNLRVCGAPARIQVIASVHEALAVAAARLDRQVARLSGRWESWPWPDPQRPPLTYISEAGIARRKTIQLRQCTPCQAAAAMNAMDYDVHLFTDMAAGEEAVVYRAGPTGLRLARQHRMHPPAQPAAGDHRQPEPHPDPHPAPRRRPRQPLRPAIPVFRRSHHRARHLLYRRYDGDLTLITPTHPETARA